ncbi:hypothetical protein B0H14DRAFT_3753138 [Mycena olivaceomarginata]|nr:hypothetical protein B0H14DRAFT_3753138 [Mycena olivaceomarginata]
MLPAACQMLTDPSLHPRHSGIPLTFRGLKKPPPPTTQQQAIQFGIIELSKDSVDDQKQDITTHLSEMYAWDKSRRVLFGPIRFVNHSCHYNAEFWYFENTEHAISITAYKDIAVSEQITVDYGAEWFEGGEKCLCAKCQVRIPIPEPQIRTVDDEDDEVAEQRAIANKRRQREYKKNQRARSKQQRAENPGRTIVQPRKGCLQDGDTSKKRKASRLVTRLEGMPLHAFKLSCYCLLRHPPSTRPELGGSLTSSNVSDENPRLQYHNRRGA